MKTSYTYIHIPKEKMIKKKNRLILQVHKKNFVTKSKITKMVLKKKLTLVLF